MLFRSSAYAAGVSLSFMSIGWPVASAVAGRMMIRTSYRQTAIMGGFFLMVGAMMLAFIDPARGVPWGSVAAFLVGCGLGFVNSPFMVALQDAAPWNVRGVATASNAFNRMFGAALGTAIAFAIGLTLPDADLPLWLGHRSGVTHSILPAALLPPALLYFAGTRHPGLFPPELAGKINSQMPYFCVAKLARALNERGINAVENLVYYLVFQVAPTLLEILLVSLVLLGSAVAAFVMSLTPFQCHGSLYAVRKGDIYVVDGMKQTIPMSLVAAAGKDPSTLSMRGAKFEELHRGGWDPKARLGDQDKDGVGAEIIYPTVGMVLCNHPDPDYKKASFDAYNRWLQGYVSSAPDRLIGVGQTPIRSVEIGRAHV